ncbi:pyrroline-5-carboxylate reductase family protein [Ancylobacter radicis]|uniref:Pyrroline-5-carboxylate reductase n=1 Tax=Ancylobacter radicis TaxID=2836179 RepID=A0ABS5R6X5_9HYPH|nr:pyrroline-5-carboxylate reductase dimerization domain-containing protein [Ancylobacter radicis]MBS9477414.1 NAD(P)-binding domain-containing protein [Ancylobacter radicis]
MTDDTVPGRLGLIGCGQLGGAIAGALLRAGVVPPLRLTICTRSGPAGPMAEVAGIVWTADPQAVAQGCDTLLLALPPMAGRALRLAAGGRLVISVMAGVTLAQLATISGSPRRVRAMSNPAAQSGMAYSPFYAPGLSDADRAVTRAVFDACGLTDEVPEESQMDVFTAVTGPVPGFVAYVAQCMQEYAQSQGVAPDTARRAVAQLFRAAGTLMADSERPPAAFVQEMLDYAGTTAAGLAAMQAAGLPAAVAQGLEAARQRCLTIGAPED